MQIDTPNPVPEVSIEKVDALCLRALFERARQATLLAPLGSVFLCWIERDKVAVPLLLAWLVINSLPDAVTFVLTSRLLRQDVAGRHIAYWLNWQVALRGLQGLAWGSAAWFFHTGSFSNDLVVLTVLIAVSATSVINMAPSFRTLAVFSIAVLMVPFSMYVWIGDVQHLEFAVGILVLLGVELQFGLDAYRQFAEGVGQLVRNQAISAELEQAMARVSSANADLKQRNQQLADALQQLHIIATHDELTDVHNRHFIVAQLDRQHEQFVRYGNVCSIVLLDIDHFKLVNDRHGHAVGDRVLVAFSHGIEGLLRQGDFIGRYGGEEFLLVLPMTDLAAAHQLAQRIRAHLNGRPLIEEPVRLEVTASFGIAQLRSGESIDAWLQRADRALYRAKESGRNCVICEPV
jgi:diguanylate cyclase (GGDEF)-like protein